jgi:hypothetical protein
MNLTTSNLKHIVDHGSVVLVDDDLNIIITWNGSQTYLWWSWESRVPSGYVNVDIMTIPGKSDLHRATYQAEEWVKRVLEEFENC